MKASICTFTGVEFFPMAPRVEDIHIEDIAHALSCMPRFAGHTAAFYSVAQHSLLVANRIPKRWALYGLLHDASEAYLLDLPTPIKQLMPVYQHAERRLLSVIGQRFDLPDGWFEHPEVKRVDNQLLRIEQAHLMPQVSWWPRPELDETEQEIAIVPMKPVEAEMGFLGMFKELNS